MNTTPVEAPILTFSIRIYRALLVAYPARFRREYGPHMLQVFRDSSLRTYHRSGGSGMVRLWTLTLLDLIRSVLEQHTQKEAGMSRSQFIKLSGWSFILGSLAFLASVLGGSLAASVISAILLAVGLVGLRVRYGEPAGGLGRSIALAGAIGMVLLYAALTVLYLALGSANPFHASRYFHPESLWIVLWGGPAIVLLALTLFGLTILRSRPMPRLNWLPAFAGIWYPALYFSMASYLIMMSGEYPWQIDDAVKMIIGMQAVALCVLGFVLVADTPREMATA